MMISFPYACVAFSDRNAGAVSYLELTRPDDNNDNSEDEIEKQKTEREERIEKNRQWRLRKSNGDPKKYFVKKDHYDI